MTRLTSSTGGSSAEEYLRELLVRAQKGDAKAYRAFLDELATLMRGFFRKRMFRMPDDVEDLLQETLIAVHNARHTYDCNQPLTAWVYAIARYKLADFLRARSRREALHDRIDEDADVFAISDALSLEAKRDLTRLLERLPSKQRHSIVEVKLQGRSVAEVAATTGWSESAIKVGVHRGLKALSLLVGRAIA